MATVPLSNAALTIGSRYQAQETVRQGGLSRFWDKVTRSSRQQVAVHLPAAGSVPGRHVATGVPRADFRRMMGIASTAQLQALSATEQRGAAHTARDLLAAASIPSRDLDDGEAIGLAQQLGRGEFEFAFRAAPESLQSAFVALEARDPQAASLLLDAFQLGQGEDWAADQLSKLLGALRGPAPGTDLPVARAALEAEFRSVIARDLGQRLGLPAKDMSSGFTEPTSDRLLERDRAVSALLGRLLVDDKHRLMSKAGIELTLQVCTERLPPASANPTSARTLRLLAALAKEPTLRESVSAIGDSVGDSPRIAPAGAALVRASLGLSSADPVSRASMQRAALGALFAPLRQGSVGSCFATSVGGLLKDLHPAAFLRDIKRMLEDGEIVRLKPGPQPVRQSVPLTAQTDTSRLNGSIDKRIAGTEQRVAHLAKALMVGQPDHLTFGQEAQDALNALLADARQRAANGGASREPSVGDVLQQVIARRHGATAVMGDLDQARARLRDLITERADLKERVIPETEQRAKTLPADRAKLVDERQAALKRLGELKALDQQNDDLFGGPNYRFLIKDKELSIAGLSRQIEAIDAAPQRLVQVKAREAQIDAQILEAEETLVRLAEAESTIDDREAYLQDLQQARALFLAQVDDPLLRAWEYTMASQIEVTQSGSRTRSMIDSQSAHLGAMIKREVAGMTGGPRGRGLPDSLARDLLDAWKTLATERFRFVYDASTRTALAADGSSTAGSWRLHVKEDGAASGPGQPIAGKQDFKELSADLLRAAADRIANRYRGRVDLPALTDKLALQMLQSDALVESVTQDLAQSKDKDDEVRRPWLIKTGGYSEPILAAAWGVPPDQLGKSAFAGLSAGPGNTAENLLDTVIDNIAVLRRGLSAEQIADPDRLLLHVTNQGHAFVLQPGHPDLRTLLQDPADPAAFKSELKQRAVDRLAAPLDRKELNRALSGMLVAFLDGQGQISDSGLAFAKTIGAADKPGAPLTADRVLEMLGDHLRAQGVAAPEVEAQTRQVQTALFQTVIAPRSHAALADLNWNSGSDPSRLAVAYNPFTSRFESGVVQVNAQRWRTDDSLPTKGLQFSAEAGLLLRTPTGIP